MKKSPDKIKIRGGRVHNLKNIDVDIPLNEIVGIAGVSGSGKSSLALGILYAEGSRRYLESLSTYTRRRMTQAEKAQVDEVLYVPAALAPRPRPWRRAWSLSVLFAMHIFLRRVRKNWRLTVKARASAATERALSVSLTNLLLSRTKRSLSTRERSRRGKRSCGR